MINKLKKILYDFNYKMDENEYIGINIVTETLLFILGMLFVILFFITSNLNLLLVPLFIYTYLSIRVLYKKGHFNVPEKASLSEREIRQEKIDSLLK